MAQPPQLCMSDHSSFLQTVCTVGTKSQRQSFYSIGYLSPNNLFKLCSILQNFSSQFKNPQAIDILENHQIGIDE